jgi:hypothetical protein
MGMKRIDNYKDDDINNKSSTFRYLCTIEELPAGKSRQFVVSNDEGSKFWVEKYESAQNSSGLSLTAIVEKVNETSVLRIGVIPAAKGAICALNEIGRWILINKNIC